MKHHKNRTSGFTLIELMISLVIGAIVISAGLSVYVQTSASRNVLRAELALQENSYYIDQILRQMLNQAGHRPLITSLLSTPLLPVKMPEQSFDETGGGATDADSADSWNSGEYIKALNNGIAIRFNGSSDSTGNADGTLIDCQGMSVAEGQTTDVAFTVSDGSLFCSSGGTSVELIAEADGVLIERIEILWGLDTNNDRSVDEYRAVTSALNAGESVLSARILMLLSSRDEVTVSNSSFSFNGVEYSALDSRLRRETVTTVQFKN